jgi:NAD(P)-dependent dehydrogenase (short-subunit alcohol dehydrogenase family)
MDNLVQAQGSRIIFTSSVGYSVHNGGILNFDSLPVTKENFSFTIYGLTKLLQILYVKESQKIWAEKGIYAFTFHPGFVSTKFGTETMIGWLTQTLSYPFARSIDQGASTGVYCALSDEALEFAGGYFESNAHKVLPDKMIADEICKQVREETLNWIGSYSTQQTNHREWTN